MIPQVGLPLTQYGAIAMPLTGVRELRERANELLRQVREERTEYVITYSRVLGDAGRG